VAGLFLIFKATSIAYFWVAGITGVSHHAWIFFLFNGFWRYTELSYTLLVLSPLFFVCAKTSSNFILLYFHLHLPATFLSWLWYYFPIDASPNLFKTYSWIVVYH
jgi:hypothetical protein